MKKESSKLSFSILKNFKKLYNKYKKKRGGNKLIVEVDHNLNLIYNIRFKNITLYINSAVGTLFSKQSG